MAKSKLRLVPPDSELRTVALRRRSNTDMGRDREHLTELEVARLIKVAKGNRHGHRDATMILIGFRHGLRVSELCSLQWSSIEFETGTVYVRRAKGGQEATHPLLGDELRALRELKRQSAARGDDGPQVVRQLVPECVVGHQQEPGLSALCQHRLGGAGGLRVSVEHPVKAGGRAFLVGQLRGRGPGQQRDLAALARKLLRRSDNESTRLPGTD